MALSRTDRVEPTGASLDGLALTPEDFFVFSRVDGRATVGEVIAASGLPGASAEEILGRLIELGVLRQAGGATPGPRPRAHTPLRDQAADRRRSLLAAQMKAVMGGGGSGSGGGPAETAAASAPAGPVAPDLDDGPPRDPTAGTRVRLVPVDDPRVDPSLSIPVEDQRLALALEDQLAGLTHFDLLGIAPTNDKKELRRAYHHISRKFHPDAYYGRELGRFRALLEVLFKRIRVSYDLLNDDAKREGYVQRLLAERAREQAQLEAQRGREREAQERVERVRAEREALERQVERHAAEQAEAAERLAREERDRARKERMGRRLNPHEGRARRGKEHFDAGLVELEARRYGAAASMFRLALDLDPNNAEYHEHWHRALAEARTQRAARAFEAAKQLEETGRVADATHYYLEAAEANPTPRHLGHAALALRETDTARARELALRALDGLHAAEKLGHPLPAKEAGSVHAMCGYVFLAAGQKHTAKEQAELAAITLGETDNVKALLAAIKSA
jgi:curved DNA-binding protein CbpA